MTRSLKKIALIVSLGTLLSKAGGLTRQLVIAGVFGVSAAYDAYNYAYVLPGFFLVLLGGINGPFHNAMVSVLSRRPKEENEYLLAAMNSITSSGLILITVILIFAANPLIHILGPGLSPDLHRLAVIQLQIMAPITFFAGLIGIGFGSLNAKEEYLIPSISPIMSSLALMIFVGGFWIYKNENIESINFEITGAIVLAIGTTTGAFLQWIIQLPSLFRNSFNKKIFIWNWNHPGVIEILKILGPATLSAGMLQLNVITDLFFASGIAGAAAGLSYANFLIQAPLGLVSNSLLIPLLPTFSRLANPKNNEDLIKRIKQGLMLSITSMIAIGIIFITLGVPIVELIYQRGAFEKNAVGLVGGIVIAYGFGMPAYLGRDILVRVFYALGDGITPFRISTLGIVLNIVFDWLLIGGPTPWGNQIPFSFGAAGLVLATGLINFLTCLLLLFKLKLRLSNLPLNKLSIDTLKLIFSGIVSGTMTSLIHQSFSESSNLFLNLFAISVSSGASIIIFGFLGSALGVQEVNELIKTLRKKIIGP